MCDCRESPMSEEFNWPIRLVALSISLLFGPPRSGLSNVISSDFRHICRSKHSPRAFALYFLSTRLHFTSLAPVQPVASLGQFLPDYTLIFGTVSLFCTTYHM